jgi:hypothetical protein
MDVENHASIVNNADIERPTFVENPMNVEIIPVAEVVGIEVLAEVLVEQRPKPQTPPLSHLGFYETINYYVSMSTAILLMLSILGGLILFMVWFCSPRTLGDTTD